MLHIKSKAIMNLSEISIIKQYWQKIDNKWRLFGLGQYRRHLYDEKLETMKDHIGRSFKPENNTVEKSESEPNKLSTIENVKSQSETESLSYTVKQQSSKPLPADFVSNTLPFPDIQLPKSLVFMPVPSEASVDQVIKMIKNDFVGKRESIRKDGIYPGFDVLETNSIMKQYNIPFGTSEMIIQKEFSNNKKKWQQISKETEADYVNTIKERLEKIDSAIYKPNELKEVLNSWDYTLKKIKLLKQQYDTKKRYYDIHQTLHNVYCLTFTLATSEIDEQNYTFIRHKSDALAKYKINTDDLLKKINKIESNFIQVNQFYNSILRSTYTAEISMDSFNYYIFRPKVYYGKLRKFKIDLIEPNNKPDESQIIAPVVSDFAKAYIIVSGNENLIVNNDTNTCTNIAEVQNDCFNIWIDALKKHSKSNIPWGEEQKNITQAMINDVIKDNCISQIKKQRIISKKQKELDGINNTIAEEKNKMRDIIDRLKKHGINEDLTVEQDIEPLYKKYSKKYNNEITERQKEYDSVANNQPVVAYELIDGTYAMDEIDKNILSKIDGLKNKMDTFCPDLNWGEQLIQNQQLENDDVQIVRNEHIQKASISKIKGYAIPQITLLREEQTSDSKKCTVPVFFKIDCISQTKSFVYHKHMNAIEDLTTKTYWKIISSQNPRILKRRRIKDSDYHYPSSFLEYQNFCTSYARYRNKWSNFPEIVCVNRYEIINDHSFIDNFRHDQWKIVEKSTYPDFATYSRDSDWMINSYESLQRLFIELKGALKNGTLEMKLIKMFSGKAFWTNTRIDNGYKSVAIFDFSKKYLVEDSKKENGLFWGILTKKIVE